ncbi:MAG: 5-formyltetrahydrofolate cyclo-ligase [Planctomycetota bacterium]
MSIAEQKKAMRTEMKLALARLGPMEIAARSAAACGFLVDRFGAAKTVMAYLAMPVEADPAGAMAVWRARGARVCAPRSDWESRTMEPAVLGGKLIEGAKGIREPGPSQPVVETGELEVVVVPGLGFTATGDRLGRGAGFYDRFLARLGTETVTVGLAVSVQIVDDLPTEPTDRRVDMVVTEDGLVSCRAGDSEGV